MLRDTIVNFIYNLVNGPARFCACYTVREQVRFDEPDAKSARGNKVALTEGPRAVQVVDLDLPPGAGLHGYFRNRSSCALGRTRRRMKMIGVGFDPDCDCDPDPDADPDSWWM